MKNTYKSQIKNWFQTQLGTFENQNVIWLNTEEHCKIKIQKLLSYTQVFHNAHQNTTYILDTPDNRSLLGLLPKNLGKSAFSQITPVNLIELRKFQDQLILKGFSNNTQRTYTTEFAQLLQILGDFPANELSAERVRAYILYCHQEFKLSENQIHSRINALKFYYEKVLHQDKILINIPRPKKPLLLPKSLNIEEIKKIIQVTENLKHRLIIKLCYGMGLRVSEIINLKIEDIDSQRMQVLIQRSKGKKDRYVNLPENILEELRAYYKEFRPENYLFEGQNHGPYNVRSAQAVFKLAMKKAGIHKRIGIHALRHSYATHLLEYGTDISLIQKLLGHNNIKTTLIYTQTTDRLVRNVKSPLDRI